VRVLPSSVRPLVAVEPLAVLVRTGELGGGMLGAANVGVLLAVAVVPLDEEHAASPMASTIIPVRAASFPIGLLGALFADATRYVWNMC
jgi:hypothetical protein